MSKKNFDVDFMGNQHYIYNAWTKKMAKRILLSQIESELVEYGEFSTMKPIVEKLSRKETLDLYKTVAEEFKNRGYIVDCQHYPGCYDEDLVYFSIKIPKNKIKKKPKTELLFPALKISLNVLIVEIVAVILSLYFKSGYFCYGLVMALLITLGVAAMIMFNWLMKMFK